MTGQVAALADGASASFLNWSRDWCAANVLAFHPAIKRYKDVREPVSAPPLRNDALEARPTRILLSSQRVPRGSTYAASGVPVLDHNDLSGRASSPQSSACRLSPHPA